MKGITIYRGKYGATQQYADWIAEELEIQAISYDTPSYKKLILSEFVVICSSVYMGQLLIKRWIKRNAYILQDKKLYIVVVCLTASTERAKQEEILKNNLDFKISGKCEIFFLPGRLVIEKLSFKDRLALKLGPLFVKDPAQKAAMKHNIDGVNKEYIYSLVGRIRKYSSIHSEGI